MRELIEGQLPSKIKYKDFRDLLKIHLSSRERYLFYDKIYKKIEKYSDLDVIIDLACGFNPFSIIFLNKKPRTYVAIDYYDKIIEILEKEAKNFEKYGIKLIVDKVDLIFNLERIKEYLETYRNSTIFFFKTITIFSRIRKDYFEYFFNFLKNYRDNIDIVVISASKFSFSGLRRIPADEKIKKKLDKLDLEILEEFDIPNEKFWIIKL